MQYSVYKCLTSLKSMRTVNYVHIITVFLSFLKPERERDFTIVSERLSCTVRTFLSVQRFMTVSELFRHKRSKTLTKRLGTHRNVWTGTIHRNRKKTRFPVSVSVCHLNRVPTPDTGFFSGIYRNRDGKTGFFSGV